MSTNPRQATLNVCKSLLVLSLTIPAVAQTSQPADTGATSEAKAYDPWTSKTMTGDWFGLGEEMDKIGLDFSLAFQHQYQQNFRGGKETHNGSRQTGTYDAVLKLDLEKIGLIENAGFYFKWKGSYGDGISSSKVGALGKVNSDTNGDHPVFVKKWWYWHKFLDDKIELRLGMIETNKDLFDVSLYANHEDKDFLNRTSSRNPTIPHQTGIGAFLKVEPVEWFYMQGAVVDAQARDRRTGFDTAFHDEAHFLAFYEFGFTPEWETEKGPLPGSYRMGLWYDPTSQKIFKNTLGGRLRDEYRGDDVGFYIGLDQMVFKENDDPKDKQGLGVFARYGYAHSDVNTVDSYWQTGTSYTGLIPTRDKDVFGFSVAQAMISEQRRAEVDAGADRETVYEWYYKFYVTPWLNISPDLQVITNPGGDKDARDAIVGGIRLQVIF